MALDGALCVGHVVPGCTEPETLNHLLYCVPCARIISSHPSEVQDDTAHGFCPRTFDVVHPLDVASAGGRSRAALQCPDCQTQLVPKSIAGGGSSLRCPHCCWDSQLEIGLRGDDSYSLIAAAMRLARNLGDSPYQRRISAPILSEEQVRAAPGGYSGTAELEVAAGRAVQHTQAVAALAAADPSIGGHMPRVSAGGRPWVEARADFEVKGRTPGRKGAPRVHKSSPGTRPIPTKEVPTESSTEEHGKEKPLLAPGGTLPPGIARLERRMERRRARVDRQLAGAVPLGDRGTAADESCFDPIISSGFRGSRTGTQALQPGAAAAARAIVQRTATAGTGDPSGGEDSALREAFAGWALPAPTGSRQGGGAWLLGGTEDDEGGATSGGGSSERRQVASKSTQTAPRPLPLMRFRHLRCRRCVAAGRPGILMLPQTRGVQERLAPRATTHKDKPPPAAGTKPHLDQWSKKADFAGMLLPSLGVTGFVPAISLPGVGVEAPAARSIQAVSEVAKRAEETRGLSPTVRARVRRSLHMVSPGAALGVQESIRAVLRQKVLRAAGQEYIKHCERELQSDPGWEPAVPVGLSSEVEGDCLLGWVLIRAVNPVPATVTVRLSQGSSIATEGEWKSISEQQMSSESGESAGGKGAGGSSLRTEEQIVAWWPVAPQPRLPLGESCASATAEETAFFGSTGLEPAVVVLEPAGLQSRHFRAQLDMPDVSVLEDEEDGPDAEEDLEVLRETSGVSTEGTGEAAAASGSGSAGTEGSPENDPWVVRRVHNKAFVVLPVRVPPAVAIALAAQELQYEERRGSGDAVEDPLLGRTLVACLGAAVELPGTSAEVDEAWHASHQGKKSDIGSDKMPTTACIDLGQLVLGFGRLGQSTDGLRAAPSEAE